MLSPISSWHPEGCRQRIDVIDAPPVPWIYIESEPTMAVTVYRYGVHYRWELPEVLTGQLRLAHNLREDLVTLQIDHEQTRKDIWSSYPAVAAAEATLAAAEEAAESALEKVKAQRVRQRTRRVTGPYADTLREARAAAKAARQARRDAIAAVHEDAKARLSAAGTALKAAQKALYVTYCQAGDLFWASFNDVLDHHRTAVKRVQQQRAEGRPAQLRHHRFDGSGSIAVQLQRQAGVPPRTPMMIADGETGKWRNVLYVPGWQDPEVWEKLTRAEQRQQGRVVVRMRCGPGHIEIPVQAHRWLPPDADITGARLTVRRIAGSIRAHLTITAKLPDPEPVTDGPLVALHLGWLDTDQGIQVATWRASDPVDIPPDLRHVFHAGRGRHTGVVLIPHRVADRLAKIDQVRSDRDIRLDVTRERLVEWLAENGPVPHPTRDGEEITAADVARWRSPGRFAALALAWRDASPDVRPAVAGELEVWRRDDRHDWERQEHGRAKVLGHRDDLYRQVAAVIADQARMLVVDDTSVAQLARRETDLPAEVEQRIAHRRTIAAPGSLREAVVSACKREGVPVRVVKAAGLSRVHARCGHENPADDRYMSRPVLCDGCGAEYDPDESATVLMLQRAAAPEEQASASAS